MVFWVLTGTAENAQNGYSRVFRFLGLATNFRTGEGVRTVNYSSISIDCQWGRWANAISGFGKFLWRHIYLLIYFGTEGTAESADA